MYRRDARPHEVLAVTRGRGRLDKDRAHNFPLDFSDEASPSSNALSRYFGRLIHRGVVESHGAEAGIGAMEQERDSCNESPEASSRIVGIRVAWRGGVSARI